MPRPRKQTDLDQKIANVLISIAPQIASVLREHVAAALREAVHGGGAPTATHSAKPAARKGKQKRNFPAHCIVPGCTNKHKGPGSGFFCEEHQKLSSAEKAKIKAARAAGSAPKATKAAAPKGAKKKAKRNFSPAARKRMSDLMKARWAKKKAAKKA